MLNADLKVLTGRHEGKVITLNTKKFLVGRGEDCHLRPNSDLVSRHHCVFTLDEYSVRVRDLGSTNGTVVNGETLQGQRVLESGDRVQIGKLEFEVYLKQAADEEVPSNDQIDEQAVSDQEDSHIVSQENVAGQETVMQLPPQPDELHEVAPHETAMISDTDTTIISTTPDPGVAGMPPQQPPPAAYPPGYPPAAPPGYQYPPGVPYPPYQQQQPYGVPPMPGYPGYPVQAGAPVAYPHHPAVQPVPPAAQPIPGVEQQIPLPAVDESEPVADEKKVDAIPVKLPDPSETGVKDEPVKAEEKSESSGESQPVENPSTKAADLIRQMRERRPGT